MKREITQKSDYISIPVQLGTEDNYLEIFDGTDKIFEFKVPVYTDRYDYIVKVNAKGFLGHDLTFIGDFPNEFFDIIEMNLEEVKCTEARPQVHFTSKFGWINDPNGLIYDGEKFHLYFQYNPFDIKWNNMSWGHATSTDLMHWQQHDTVLYPDGMGTIFSGCGLIKDGEYLFPYTIAGDTSPWSKGKPFCQGLAKSYDKGMSLQKSDDIFLGITGKDSRDPKIFWHEETSSYIMVLFLENNDFGIFRSPDLQCWEMTQKLSLEKDGGWECPDLLKISGPDGESKWMFWCADGLYYWGTFDGYTFSSDFVAHHAYGNWPIYATQSFWGTEDRVVAIPWLRFEERMGMHYQGAMGIPREYSYKEYGDDSILVQKPAQELRNSMITRDEVPTEGAYLVEMSMDLDDVVDIQVNGSHLIVDRKNRFIELDGKKDNISIDFDEIELLVDYNILEITVSNAIVFAYLVAETTNNFEVSWRENGNTKGCGRQDGANSNYSIKSFK